MTNMMQKTTIKLKLSPGEDSLEFVRRLEGVKDLKIDDSYGLICISPKRHLYTILAIGDVNRDDLMNVQPRVQGVYGQVKVSEIDTE